MNKQSNEYISYMKSDLWKQKKLERMKIDCFKCAACGYSAKPQILMVHHFTYERLGHEDVWKDLATICPVCHKKLHRLLKRKQTPTD